MIPTVNQIFLAPIWDDLTARARAGHLNEAHLHNLFLVELAQQATTNDVEFPLPPTLEWVFRFPDEFVRINVAHAKFLRRHCETTRCQVHMRERLLRSPAW